jgi:hypothetical protein
VNGAKEIAQATSRVIDSTKKFASNISEKPKQQALLKAAQGVAAATGAFARAAQVFNSDNPNSLQQVSEQKNQYTPITEYALSTYHVTPQKHNNIHSKVFWE